eukprot:2217667-Pyramimonas_sp.AAC.1
MCIRDSLWTPCAPAAHPVAPVVSPEIQMLKDIACTEDGVELEDPKYSSSGFVPMRCHYPHNDWVYGKVTT